MTPRIIRFDPVPTKVVNTHANDVTSDEVAVEDLVKEPASKPTASDVTLPTVAPEAVVVAPAPTPVAKPVVESAPPQDIRTITRAKTDNALYPMEILKNNGKVSAPASSPASSAVRESLESAPAISEAENYGRDIGNDKFYSEQRYFHKDGSVK